MPFLVGVLIAVGVGVLASSVGWYRDRSFYSVVTVVVGSYYALFSVMAASSEILVLEIAIGMVFLALAIMGSQWSLWVIVAAQVAHGTFDLTHELFFSNPSVPVFWPEFCSMFDFAFALYLAWLLKSKRIAS